MKKVMSRKSRDIPNSMDTCETIEIEIKRSDLLSGFVWVASGKFDDIGFLLVKSEKQHKPIITKQKLKTCKMSTQNKKGGKLLFRVMKNRLERIKFSLPPLLRHRP